MAGKREAFQAALTEAYRDLFANDAEYRNHGSMTTPERLAERMTEALASGTGNKDGKGIKRTCKALGIKYTYGAIREYLADEVEPPFAL